MCVCKNTEKILICIIAIQSIFVWILYTNITHWEHKNANTNVRNQLLLWLIYIYSFMCSWFGLFRCIHDNKVSKQNASLFCCACTKGSSLLKGNKLL